MAREDYWYVCTRCKQRFPFYDPHLEYTTIAGRRRRVYKVLDTVMNHRASTGHENYTRKAAPAV